MRETEWIQRQNDVQIHGILESWPPVILFGDAILVGLGKGRVMVQLNKELRDASSESKVIWNTYGGDSQAELTHGMKCGRASVKNLFHEFWNCSTGSPIARKLCDLLLGWDFAGDQKPEETFGKGFGAARCCWELGLNLRDSFATEANSFL